MSSVQNPSAIPLYWLVHRDSPSPIGLLYIYVQLQSPIYWVDMGRYVQCCPNMKNLLDQLGSMIDVIDARPLCRGKEQSTTCIPFVGTPVESGMIFHRAEP